MDHMKRAIQQFSDPVPTQAKQNANVKLEFKKSNMDLIDVFVGFERFEEDFYANPDTSFIKQKPVESQKTNADRIRAMSNEELASFMKLKRSCPDETKHKGCVLNCGDCWLEWLNELSK